METSCCKRSALNLIATLLLTLIATSYEADSNCRTPLGMHSGAIPDSAINASSSYDYSNVGPASGRIRTERNGGAWCPRRQSAHTAKDVYEYLEISFPELKMITQIETQGRFGNGQGLEYVESYKVEYQRLDGGAWRRYRNFRDEEDFVGNTNTYEVVARDVIPAIIASRIRIIPSSSRTVCMRVELLGCSWKSGLLSYSMRKGDKRGSGSSSVEYGDFSYDGRIQNNQLSGGLGQLTDGIEGLNKPMASLPQMPRKGFEWVGWQNKSATGPPVEILFEFDRVRNFTEMRVHSNNNFMRDVRVFRMAKLYFSVGGMYYQEKPVVYEYMRDTVMESARPVIIPINNRIGRFVRVDFYFDAKWILISEVLFESEIATSEYTVETKFPSDSLSTSRQPPPLIDADYDATEAGFDDNDILKSDQEINFNDEEQNERHRRNRSLEDHYIGIISGIIVILMLMLGAVILLVVRSRRRRKCESKGHLVDSHQVTLNLNDLRVLTSSTSKLSNGNLYNSIQTGDDDMLYNTTDRPYREPCDVLIGRKLPDLPITPASTVTRASQEYAVPELIQMLGVSKVPLHNSKLPYPKAGTNPVRALDLVTSVHSHSANSLYPMVCPNMQIMSGSLGNIWNDCTNLLEFPRSNLHFIEKLGEGQFGEVHLCEASNMGEFLGDDFLVNRTNSMSMLVAVKVMRPDADPKSRTDFEKEMKMLSRLRDPNVVRVLGMCVEGGPLSVIVEYMKYGDLHQFLQQHVPQDGTAGVRKRAESLSNGCLIYMAMQIASGMKYLESLNLVHRDLATRNCLVGSLYTIKIADFGMSRSLYSGDYYRIEGKVMLPIRWMAWESIVLGKFSTKSDVWSFGVTLWEIVTFARLAPYESLTDEQVIENCGHFYDDNDLVVYLPMAPGCSKEIYDLMKTCWNRDDSQRPTFREIHMFLQRKNLGYKPQEDWVLSGIEKASATSAAAGL